MRSSGEDLDPVAIAIAALSHFATEPKILSRFFALSGLDANSIRAGAMTPGFTAGVLDFVLQDDELTIAVAAAQDTTPEAIVAARASLDAPREADDWPPQPHDDWA